jgi:hypothetical protein
MHKSQSKIWKSFHPGPNNKTRRNTKGTELYQWDYKHGGEIEVYNKYGEHLGVKDPETGEMIKQPVKGRRIPVK